VHFGAGETRTAWERGTRFGNLGADHDPYEGLLKSESPAAIQALILSFPSLLPLMPVEQPKFVVLVTGGTGLVGYAIQHVIDTEPLGSRFGRREGEAWIFLSSKDADLRFVSFCTCKHLHPSLSYLSSLASAGIQSRQKGSSIGINPHTSFISPRSVRCPLAFRLIVWHFVTLSDSRWPVQ
jgi:hypothetical protein